MAMSLSFVGSPANGSALVDREIGDLPADEPQDTQKRPLRTTVRESDLARGARHLGLGISGSTAGGTWPLNWSRSAATWWPMRWRLAIPSTTCAVAVSAWAVKSGP